ncbi:GH25 family lysozyme [Beduini massiliensis]|uniref:GH25 family lysozyme n=1 Tax=Beduini massiliensis TaxID=1585974 RepID=UPI0006936537|nr:GH25 family lysozyme [Beduini massiliensis]
MSLYGIDISSWQSNLYLNQIAFDFAIVKATEGIDYINPFFNEHAQQVLNKGKKLGLYHFANNSQNTPEQEAKHFISQCRDYIGKAVLVLDWEEETADIRWALEWLKMVERETGVKPMIYMSESVVNQYDWSPVVANGNGLWVAKYRDYEPDYNYDMTSAGTEPKVNHWSFYAMWQFTSSGRLDGYSGNLDCNIFYGDLAAWDKYAGVTDNVVDQPTAPMPAPTPQPLKHRVGEYVYFGSCYRSSTAKVGWPPNGEALVPDIKEGTITAIYPGTNNPYLINNGMCFVNDGDIQEATSNSDQQYIVKSGDTLWDIAAQLLGDPTRYRDIMLWNGLESDTIYPGQALVIKG